MSLRPLRPLTSVKWGTFMGIQVYPSNVPVPSPAKPPPKFVTRVTPFELTTGLYHWATCLFIVALVCSQLLGAVWDSQTSTRHILFGRNPTLGPSQIVGTNDVPYPDRVVACVRRGNSYEPKLVSSLLAAPGVSAILEDSTGTALHGYRLRQRRVGAVSDSLDSATQIAYEASCRLIASTMDNIFNACLALGYTNLTRDSLRVVDDWDSNNLYLLPNTLPILIMPYWDNAPQARHAVPTYEGDACMFRLQDAYAATGSASKLASFRAVNRSVRFERTIEWLGRPGGRWKNGWYEDLEGVRWYADLTSSAPEAPYYMMFRLFNMRTGTERDCSSPSDCEAAGKLGRWGDKFISSSKSHKFSSVSIANGTEFGLFLYESDEIRNVRIVFDWETLVSNLSVGLVLARWIVGLISLHAGALRGKTPWFSGGIGCVSGAGSFMLLPVVSLPRLKMTLAAFWTVGCRFEGQQSGLADAWFAIYPAIAHLVLVYFSLLNILAKALRRRISDVLFTPTVAAFCLLHYFRMEIAESGWLEGIDGRISTVVFSDEVDKMQLADYFTTDLAWRMNGRVALIFWVKVGILAVNLLPLLLARSFPMNERHTETDLHGVEKALALRARHVGGLGKSLTYIVVEVDRKKRRVSSRCHVATVDTLGDASNAGGIGPLRSDMIENCTRVTPIPPLRSLKGQSSSFKQVEATHKIALVNSYELIRMGYLVFGDKYLITFDEWDLLSSMAPFKAFVHFWNHRVLVWKLRPVAVDCHAEIAGGRALQWIQPQMWRLDDPRLQQVRWWQVSACSIQC